MNEMIEIINGFASGEYFEYHGEFYDLDAMKMVPGARAAGARS